MPSRLFKNYRNLAKEFYSDRTFVAFDTETTGLNAESDYIIEIGAVKFDSRGTIGNTFDVLIKPPVLLSSFITNFTHITNGMLLEKGISAIEAITEFIIYIGGKRTILLAHNAKFDIGFINSELARRSLPPLRNLCIDTLTAAKWAYPEFARKHEKGQYRLGTLAKRLGIQGEQAHRAEDDARVCMELFKRILSDTKARQNPFDKTATIPPKQLEMEFL